MGAVNTIERIIDVFPPNQQQQIRIQLASVLECVVSQQLIPEKYNEGRVAAFEVLLANSAVRNLIRESKTFQITSVIQTNRELGMETMDDAIFDLYRKDKISKEMAIHFAQNPLNLEQRLR
jgi:twitching motility protein PilT